jgi:SAM-dependent methyltransferase
VELFDAVAAINACFTQAGFDHHHRLYDQLAPLCHLIFSDWDGAIEKQGVRLTSIIHEEWPEHRTVLDVSCGIGTQAIALANNGFLVAASDLSAGEEIPFSVCDMSAAHSHHGGGFDVVISCDNSLPHLLSDDDIRAALTEMHACLRPGGGILITVRDYDSEQRGKNLVKLHGVREQCGKRYLVFQIWDFEGEYYDVTIYFIEEDVSSKEVVTHALRSRYYAIGTAKLLGMMQETGFQNVRKLDQGFYQPVLIGSKLA